MPLPEGGPRMARLVRKHVRDAALEIVTTARVERVWVVPSGVFRAVDLRQVVLALHFGRWCARA